MSQGQNQYTDGSTNDGFPHMEKTHKGTITNQKTGRRWNIAENLKKGKDRESVTLTEYHAVMIYVMMDSMAHL